MNHITLTGNLGSGKSTICRILEDTYGYEIYSTGKVQRALAEELGISVLEMNRRMCEDHRYDKMIDDTTAKISRENQEKKIVFDSRLAWNFVEHSFKVFLSVDLNVAAERVYRDNRGAVEQYASVEEAKNQLRLRAETEDRRYREIYGIEYFNFKNYDLVLDSTWCMPELLTNTLMDEAAQAEPGTGTKVLISPKRLGFPSDAAPRHLSVYIPEKTIRLSYDGECFTAEEGKEFAEQAAAEGYSLICAQM